MLNYDAGFAFDPQLNFVASDFDIGPVEGRNSTHQGTTARSLAATDVDLRVFTDSPPMPS
jgi:hypothetical protein